MAWKTDGPICLRDAYFSRRDTNLTNLPSRFFLPDKCSLAWPSGGGKVYARQEWASTHRSHDALHLRNAS
jgi:hypothetical protein